MKEFFKGITDIMSLKKLQAEMTMALHKTFTIATLATTLLGCSAPLQTSFATGTPAAPSAPAELPVPGFQLTYDNSDPKAAEIATKLFARDIADMKTMNSQEPSVYAQFVSLGPGLPKNSIVAKFNHPSVCGSSGCETVIFENVDNKSQYRVVFDNNMDFFRFATVKGEKYYQLRLPTPTGITLTDTIWQMDTSKNKYVLRSGPRVGN